MDAGLGRTFDHYEYLVGFNAFVRVNAQLVPLRA